MTVDALVVPMPKPGDVTLPPTLTVDITRVMRTMSNEPDPPKRLGRGAGQRDGGSGAQPKTVAD